MSKKKSGWDIGGVLIIVIAIILASSWFWAGRMSLTSHTKIMERYLCKIGEIDHDWGELELVGNRAYVVRTCSRCGKTENYIFIGCYNSLMADLVRATEKTRRLEQELSRLTNNVPLEIEDPGYYFGSTNEYLSITNNYIGDITSDRGAITIDADLEALTITYDKLIRRGKKWWEFWK